MYTKYNYKYMSTIEIFVIESYSYTSMYTNYCKQFPLLK